MMVKDPFGRTIDYLRISITDRCNERCIYCMPEGYKGWAQRADHLSHEEIVKIVQASTSLGFRKFRITGGEPLIRNDLVQILQDIWNLPGVQTLGVSTNGILLARFAAGLKKAGVRSLNVSLDALDETLYRKITGGHLQQTLEGIEVARKEGFECIKLNCVLMRGVNESQWMPLAEFAAERSMPLRFIELMPLTSKDVLHAGNFISVTEVMNAFASQGMLKTLANFHLGHGPARYYEFEPLGVKLGFIGAMTQQHFCQSCNKLRLTADGKLRPCLGRYGEIDLLGEMRKGISAMDLIQQAINEKPEDHQFIQHEYVFRPMVAIGG